MVLDLAAHAKSFDIIPEFSFVLGTPSGDVDGQINRDIQYIRRIKEINPRSEIVIYIFCLSSSTVPSSCRDLEISDSHFPGAWGIGSSRKGF
jgi:anaerobic magnesium-protoporphyrin IX monomethyl ester cyclase